MARGGGKKRLRRRKARARARWTLTRRHSRTFPRKFWRNCYGKRWFSEEEGEMAEEE